MEGEVKQRKRVEIGGGWQAELVRPPVWVSSTWGRALRKGRPDQALARARLLEQGAEPTEETAKEAEADSFELTPDHIRIWEQDVYPHVVLFFLDPKGQQIERKDVWLADLGVNRFHNLMREVSDFVVEADRSFREEAREPE